MNNLEAQIYKKLVKEDGKSTFHISVCYKYKDLGKQRHNIRSAGLSQKHT